MHVNSFMLALHEKLMKDKKIAETTATLYIQNLYNLNSRSPFTSLSFLKKKDRINDVLNGYADSTKKSILGGVVSVLDMYKTKPTYKKIYEHYRLLMTNKIQEFKDKPKGVMNEKQKQNWLSWEEVEERKHKLCEEVIELQNKKRISDTQFKKLQQFFVLSLYTDIPPRRNQDYALCYIVKSFNDKLPTDRNYYVLNDEEFVFNKYKTSKSYGQQKVSVKDNETFLTTFKLYFKFHPLNKGRFGKNKQIPLLCNYDGSTLSSCNTITRILNKIFGKKVGSSMLRHFYLSSKYSDELQEMESDAIAMGHSKNEAHTTYIKHVSPTSSPKEEKTTE